MGTVYSIHSEISWSKYHENIESLLLILKFSFLILANTVTAGINVSMTFASTNFNYGVSGVNCVKLDLDP